MEKDLLLNNSTIAIFMGLKYINNLPNHLNHKLKPYWTDGDRMQCYQLFYHQDWGWLMPVIEKISSIKFKDEEDTSYPRTFGMINEEGLFMFRFNRYPLYENKSLIIAAYNAVLNYIEHYNTLNKQ